jgi:CRISPR/Cas system endoribonuclease Cas6 (RAMP superfamily)
LVSKASDCETVQQAATSTLTDVIAKTQAASNTARHNYIHGWLRDSHGFWTEVRKTLIELEKISQSMKGKAENAK